MSMSRISVSSKLTPGSTTVNQSHGEWTTVPADTFNLRIGPNYSANKKKAPSDEAIYEPVAVDVHRLAKKTFHVAKYFDLEKLPGRQGHDLKEDGELPEILVINVLCPMYAPGIFYSVNDGKGFMTTFFFRLSGKSRRCIEEKKHTSSMKLLRRFMDEAPRNPEMRGRLKGIVRAANMQDLPLNPIISGLAHRYNGTPFLIHAHEAQYFSGSNYYEMDIDLHNWSLITRNAFYQLSGILDKIRGHYAFVVEAREEDEMPEQLCCVTQIYAMDGVNAPEFPFIENIENNNPDEDFFDDNSE